MFIRLRVSRPAPASRTTDRVAWKTTRIFCGNVERSWVLRLAPRRASTGSACEANHAGAVPKSAPVSRDNKNAKASTDKDGAASMGTNFALWKVSATINLTPRYATIRPATPPRTERTMPSVSDWRIRRLRDAPRARRMEVGARRDAPRASRRLAIFAQLMRRTSEQTP